MRGARPSGGFGCRKRYFLGDVRQWRREQLPVRVACPRGALVVGFFFKEKEKKNK